MERFRHEGFDSTLLSIKAQLDCCLLETIFSPTLPFMENLWSSRLLPLVMFTRRLLLHDMYRRFVANGFQHLNKAL